MPLNPIVESLLEAMAEAGAPPLSELPPEMGREVYRAMHADLERAPMHEVRDDRAGNVPVRIYRPTDQDQLPCIVFFHGGGWVIGDLDTHDAACRLLARDTGCAVIAVDYRMAPEHPFPAAVDDSYEALCWVYEQREALNIDGERLAVAGDSAGGNLAAVMCLKARDEAGPAIKHQILVYPVTDGAMDTVSYTDNGEGYMLTANTMRWFFDQYTRPEDRRHPHVSPLLAENLKHLPPATIITAEYDPLRDEGEAYGERLKEAGVTTHIQRFEGQIHGFFTMTDQMPEAQTATQLAASQLAQTFD